MADDINATGSEQDLLQLAAEQMGKLNDSLGSMLKKLYNEQGAAAAKEFITSALSEMQGAATAIAARTDISKFFTMNSDELQKTLMDGFQRATGNLRDFSATMGVDIDTSKIDNAFSSVANGLINTETIVEAGLFTVLSEAASQLQQNPILNFLKGVEDRALKIDKMGLENFGSRLNPANARLAEASLDGLNSAYREQLQQLVNLGYSIDKANEQMQVFGKTNKLSLTELKELGAGASDVGKELQGLAGFQRILEATGMGVQVGSELLEYQMRSLGVEANRSLEIFDTLTKVQMGTRLSIDEIGSTVTAGAKNFKYFGDNVQGVATIYNQLLKGLGEGKEALAKDIFQDLTSGIVKMSTEMKAFIGLTTGLGGGGGALESALQIEEAISSGEGLNDVMDSIYSKVEEISGTPLLTRQEAVATGQSQQYFIQRQLLGQFTNIQDQGALEQLMRSRQAGQGVTLDQLRPDASFGQRIAGQSEDVLNQRIGPANRILTQIGGTAEIEGSNEISKTLLRIGQGIAPAGNAIVDALKQTSTQILQLGKQGYTLEQIKSGEAASEQRNFGQRKLKADLEKSKETGKDLGEDVSIESQLGMGQMLQKGIKPIDAMISEPAVEAATGQGSLQRLTGLLEVTSRAGNDSLKSIDAAIQDSNNKYLNSIVENTKGLAALTSADKQRENVSSKETPVFKPAPTSAESKFPPTSVMEAVDKDVKAQQQQAGASAETKTSGKSRPHVVPVDIVITTRNGDVVETKTHRIEAVID